MGKRTKVWLPLCSAATQHRKPQGLFAKAVSSWSYLLFSMAEDGWLSAVTRSLQESLFILKTFQGQKVNLLSSYRHSLNCSVEERYASEEPMVFLAKYEQFGKFIRAAC